MEIAQTADNALLALLELERSGRQTIAELSASLNLNRTITQRTVRTLHERGFVVRGLDGRYGPGPALLKISNGLPHEITLSANGMLEDLASETQETVIIAVNEGDEILVVASASGSSEPLRVEFQVGFRQPIWRGASGLAILAHLKNDPAIHHLGPIELEIIAEARAQGYARTRGQIRSDMTGAAVALLDADGSLLGSIAIIVPSIRSERLEANIPALLSTARRIEAQHTSRMSVTGTELGSRQDTK